MTTVEASSPRNAWRKDTPGPSGWPRSARPGDPNKFLMVSSDCPANGAGGFLGEGIGAEVRDPLPRVEVREGGSEWTLTEGNRPMMVKAGAKARTVQEQQSFERRDHNRH